MDYFGIVCKTVEEIEKKINEDINIHSIATSSYMSPFHFHRIFKAFTGHSVISYVRKRRLNKACEELVNSDKGIIEIAFDYGYDSNEAFTRALKKESGLTPTAVRKQKITNIGIEKMPLFRMRYEKLYGNAKIESSLVFIKSIILAGVDSDMTLEDEKNYAEISKIYKKLLECKKHIKNIVDAQNERQFGIAFIKNLDIKNPYANNFSYFRAYEVSKTEKLPKSIVTKEFDSLKCVKFSVGSTIEDHQKALYYIYGSWILESGYEINRDCFEFMEEIIEYPSGKNEIFFYIPVK